METLMKIIFSNLFQGTIVGTMILLIGNFEILTGRIFSNLYRNIIIWYSDSSNKSVEIMENLKEIILANLSKVPNLMQVFRWLKM